MIRKISHCKYKIFFYILCFFTITGFALLGSASWDVTPTDRTIWIKACNSLLTNNWASNNLNGSSDELSSIRSINGSVALKSIINDYNNVNSSLLRFAVYPEDPNNPTATILGDSTFSIEKASLRTVNVCFTKTGIFIGGHAQQEIKSGKVTGCEIVISSKHKTNLKEFLLTLTHELGHCAGLDHPMETTNAIMSYFNSEDNFRLQTDDKMGLVFQYPKTGVNVKEQNNFGLQCSKK